MWLALAAGRTNTHGPLGQRREHFCRHRSQDHHARAGLRGLEPPGAVHHIDLLPPRGDHLRRSRTGQQAELEGRHGCRVVFLFERSADAAQLFAAETAPPCGFRIPIVASSRLLRSCGNHCQRCASDQTFEARDSSRFAM